MALQTHITFIQALHRYERELVDLKIAAVMAAIVAIIAALCMVTSMNNGSYFFGACLVFLIGVEWLAIKWGFDNQRNIDCLRKALYFDNAPSVLLYGNAQFFSPYPYDRISRDETFKLR